MKKIIKAIMSKINFIVLFGLCLGFSGTLYGSEEKNDQTDMNFPNDSSKEKKEYAFWGNLKKLTKGEKSKKNKNETSLDEYIDNNIEKEEVVIHWECESIKDCEAFSCIISCLKCWSILNDTNNIKDLYKHLYRSNNYKNVINAYCHLLDKHLSKNNNKSEYEYINKKVRKEIVCDFDSCLGYTRNQRNRGKEEKNKEKQNDDKEYIFLRDFLDTIHAYLVHGNDSGHRYLSKDKGIKINNTDQKPKTDDGNNREKDSLFFDEEVENIKGWHSKIKKEKRKQNRNNKYQTKIEKGEEDGEVFISFDILKDEFYDNKDFQVYMKFLLENDCDTDNILEEIVETDDERETVIPIDKEILYKIRKYIKKQKIGKVNSYSFGPRLYYWDEFKNDEASSLYHPEYKIKELYVSPVYLSFKDEILSKKEVGINGWN